jgi:hypothetical protein
MNSTHSPSVPSRSRQNLERAAEQVLELFRQPDRLPEALAPIFIHHRDDVPCRSWSWLNQLIVALAGTDDARGYRQWEQVGRYVKWGQHSFAILVPLRKTIRDENADEERTILTGFRPSPVFGVEQTEGKPLPYRHTNETWVQRLPLQDVARVWGITVTTYSGAPGRSLGRFSPAGTIALGVQNLATWAHELVHAADHHRGALVEDGQHWRSEIVAELGGAVLQRHRCDRGPPHGALRTAGAVGRGGAVS